MWQVPGTQQRHGARREIGLREEMSFRDRPEPQADTPAPAPAGLGLHLCPQLLPLRSGHVFHPAAAQGQQEGWKRRAAGQTGLLHPVLCLYLTLHPHPHPHPTLRLVRVLLSFSSPERPRETLSYSERPLGVGKLPLC